MKKLLFLSLTVLFFASCESPESDAKKVVDNMNDFNEAVDEALKDGDISATELDDIASYYQTIVSINNKYDSNNENREDYRNSLDKNITMEIQENFIKNMFTLAMYNINLENVGKEENSTEEK